MRTRFPLLAAVAAAAVAAGCGDSKKCPTETTGIDSVADCTRRPGEVVNYPVQLCPTCNQIVSACDVDMSAAASDNQIFLNPVVEVCESASSCGGAACNLNPTTCSFTVPNVGDGTTYQIIAFDARDNQPVTGTLTVQSAVAPFCAAF